MTTEQHTRATSSFVIDSWDQQPYHEGEGVQLARVELSKTFAGDIEGTSTASLLMAGGSESGAYVAHERLVVRVHGRDGAFVLQHAAVAGPQGGSSSWVVVPDSGTGELRGLTGDGEITRHHDGSHTFTLDYHLGGA